MNAAASSAAMRASEPMRAAGVAAVSLAMSLAGSLVAEEVGWLVPRGHTGVVALDIPLSLVVGLLSPGPDPELATVESAFPLLNWFVFVAFGLVFGKLLRRCRNPDRLYALATPSALLLYAGATLWGVHGSPLIHFNASEPGFYHPSILDALLVGLPAVVFMLGTGHFAGKALKGGAAELVRRTASDLNRIYLIHWVFVMWLVDALLCRTLGLEMGIPALLFVSFAILAVSALLARLPPFSRFKL